MERPNSHSQESFSYRMAIRLFDSAFSACGRLTLEEKERVLREVGERLLHLMPKSDISGEAPDQVKIIGLSIKVKEEG